MNFEYLYLDEKALAYQEIIDKFVGANKAGAPIIKNKDDYYNVKDIYIILGISRVCKDFSLILL